ncbi:MAG: M28 family peptidase [Candidatus Thorarchaeota archaeon]
MFTLMLIVPGFYLSPAIQQSSGQIADTTHPDLQRIYGELIIDEIYEQVTYSNYQDIVQKVTENGSRYLLGPFGAQLEGPNMYLKQYLLQQLDERSNGRLEIEIIGNYFNIVAKLSGYLPGEHPAFVVSAHYDSPDESPGANCDGSGLATLLVLVEIMSQYEWPLDIYFMAFNGLHPASPNYFMEGSEEVAIELRYRGFETLAIFNVDTILVPHPSVPSDRRIQMGYDMYSSYTEGQYWAELTRTVSNNYGIDAIVPIPSESFVLWEYSDHYAFAQRDFSGAICAFESGYNIDDSYQGATDVWNNPSFRYDLGREVTAAIGSSMAYIMSRTYGEPRRFEFSFTTRTENTDRVYIPITTSTVIDVSCRWFGGSATFRLFDPNDQIIASAVFNQASAWEHTDLFTIQVSSQGLYTLTLENTGHQSIGFELNYTYDSDIDSNGVLDSQEFWIDSSYFILDEDSDGLSFAEELFLGTDDNDVDSDGDMIPDKFEVDNGLDPSDPSDGSADEDGDGLSNTQEYTGGLNMFSADSDSDQMDDLWELENGLNPLLDDSMLDADGDGKTNLQEYLEETDPQAIEQQQIPLEWYILLGASLAFIVGFLYLRRISFE